MWNTVSIMQHTFCGLTLYNKLSAHIYPVHYMIPCQDLDDILNF